MKKNKKQKKLNYGGQHPPLYSFHLPLLFSTLFSTSHLYKENLTDKILILTFRRNHFLIPVKILSHFGSGETLSLSRSGDKSGVDLKFSTEEVAVVFVWTWFYNVDWAVLLGFGLAVLV